MILFIYKTDAIKQNFLNKKIIMKCLVIEVIAWNLLELSIQKMQLQLYVQLQ